MQTRSGFTVSSSSIKRDIYIPRYYNPEIDARLRELSRTHGLVALQDLIDVGQLSLTQGNYIAKIHYGTGSIPYIRTSDIANWELQANPKHGVSRDIYDAYRAQQDIREHDILLVHEGTYLIGRPCLLTRFDTEILIQHHLAHLRVLAPSPIRGELLMAALLAPIVQQQIRARQFTADVIDSIVGRLAEVQLPIPRAEGRRGDLENHAREIFDGRAAARADIAAFVRGLDESLLTGKLRPSGNGSRYSGAVDNALVTLLGGRPPASSFVLSSTDVSRDVLVPRYYDPDISRQLEAMAENCYLVSVGELVEGGELELQTGDEVGKLAYGTGTIPFVRTSDFANWELKHDPKQLVSQDIYDEYARRQSVASGDILLVRDGTYLVGSTSIVGPYDVPMLFSGGIYRIRCRPQGRLTPFLALALLNTRVVRRQMRSKQFTRDVIDTLGHRFREVVLPVPKAPALAAELAGRLEGLIRGRWGLRAAASRLGTDLEEAGF